MERLFVRVTRENLPQLKERYPFLYLEYGRLEVDDSSVKWISADGEVFPLPIATISMLNLGPGTSITHEAVKTCAAANCLIAWTAQDALSFYAAGVSPTANTHNFIKQIEIACDPVRSVKVAHRLFAYRFPDVDVESKSVDELMGMEGVRVRNLYEEMSSKYQVGWKGRNYTAGKFELSDTTNKIMTACNAALYGLLTSGIHALGYSPHAGFIHKGSPLPFIYDLSDLYKSNISIDLAFKLTRELRGQYDKETIANAFRERISQAKLLETLAATIKQILDV